MKKTIVGLAAAAALFGGASQAEDKAFDDRIYGGLLLNYIDADNANRGVNDSRDGIRVLVGKQLNPWLGVEGTLSWNEFGNFGPLPLTRTKELSAGVEALLFPIKCTGDVRPFLKAGVGVTAYNEDYDNDLNASLGGGAFWKINDNGLSLRTDLAWRILDSDGSVAGRGDNPTEFVLGLGLTMPLGGGKVNVVEDCPKAEKAMPAETTMEKSPAPAAAPAKSMDSDGDGVADSVDQCPNTPAGAKVDVNGCPVPETVVIYFAFDSAELNSAAQAALDRVAANLVNKNFVVAIANGHADSTGTEEYNMGLSERRAASVSKYLASKGVAAGQIRQRAYGEARPAADNESEMGRAKNRRVEINLLRQ